MVYLDVSVLGATDEDRKAAFARLSAQAPQIRTALAQRIRHQVRRIPEIKFFLDEGPQQAAKMDDLFARIRAEREARGVTDEPEETEDDAPLGRGDY